MRHDKITAIDNITLPNGKVVPSGTIGTHITTQLVAPFHILVKWPGISGHYDCDPKLITFLRG